LTYARDRLDTTRDTSCKNRFTVGVVARDFEPTKYYVTALPFVIVERNELPYIPVNANAFSIKARASYRYNRPRTSFYVPEPSLIM